MITALRESSNFQKLENHYKNKIETFFDDDRNRQWPVDIADVLEALSYGKEYQYYTSKEELLQFASLHNIKSVIFYKRPKGGWESITQWSSFIDEIDLILDKEYHGCFLYHGWEQFEDDPVDEWFIVIS